MRSFQPLNYICFYAKQRSLFLLNTQREPNSSSKETNHLRPLSTCFKYDRLKQVKNSTNTNGTITHTQNSVCSQISRTLKCPR